MFKINADKKDFEICWKAFLKKNNESSWRYLWRWHNYQKKYCEQVLKKDLSFVVVENNIPIAIVPLFVELTKKRIQFSYADSYQVAPLVDISLDNKFKKKVEKFCFEEIAKLAKENEVVKILIMNDPLAEYWRYNRLQKYGFFDASIATTFVDLNLNKEKLWSNLRTRYKQYIHKASYEFESVIMDYKQPNFSIHEKYREFHHKAAGKVTRNLETFKIQYDMLEEDNAILIGLKNNNKFIAFSYFFHSGISAYYASASDDPDFKTSIPLEHLIMWLAIEYYKKRNFKLLEIGWQQFNTQFFDFPSEKDINISYFKRGFGGEIVSLYRGIKYCCHETLNEDLKDNFQIIKNNYFKNKSIMNYDKNKTYIWYENVYKQQGLNAQRRYPNEELVRFFGRNLFRINRRERKNINVLELGCGSCANLWMVAFEGFQSFGIDISEESLKLGEKILKEKGVRAEIKMASMMKIPYENNFFQVVIDVFSSNCLDLQDFNTSLDEIERILMPGGLFFSYIPSTNSDAFKNYLPAKKIDNFTLDGIKRKTSPYYGNFYPFRFTSSEHYISLLENRNFTVKYVETVCKTYDKMKENFEFVVIEATKI